MPTPLVDLEHRASGSATAAPIIPEGFALFEDGPFVQWLRRVSVLKEITDVVWRRVLVAVTVTWLPLLVLSIRDGHALHGGGLAFLTDFQTQARTLVMLPLFIISAHQAHQVITPALQHFETLKLVRTRQRAAFTNILRIASGWNHSVVVRLAIVGIVVLAGPELWRQVLVSRESSTWYGVGGDTAIARTSAGYWLLLVTNPVLQYQQLLWIARLLMFGTMMARVAALDLHLVATHPDRAGGLGFLGQRFYPFLTLIVAEGAALAGILANRIFHEGRPLPLFKVEIAIEAVMVAAMTLGPLCVFAPTLIRVKRKGSVEYAKLAGRYVREFEDTWVRDTSNPNGRALLGASDIQSLADMANSCQVVERMRPVPFTSGVVIKVFVYFLIPVAPLVLTAIPAAELLHKILEVVITL
jgi:hypothetical protein